MKKLRITVDGRVFDVTVELPEEAAPTAVRPAAAAPVSAAPVASAPVAPPPPGPATSGPAPAGAICSPLAGKVVSIDVPVGATVAAGAQVATIEAMKMNTFVYADRAGRVASIAVKPGDAVEEGAPLLTLA